jgi:PDZ domain
MIASGRLPSRAGTRSQQRGDSPVATHPSPHPLHPPHSPHPPLPLPRPLRSLPLLPLLPLLLPLLVLLSGLAQGCAMFDTGMSEAKDLQRVGVSAQAAILSIGETGLTVNDDPVITLDVEVRPADRPPYHATIKRLLVSRLEIPQFQPGRVIPVRFDPRDPSRVSFDLGPPRAASTGDPFVDHFTPSPSSLGSSLVTPPPTPALYRGSDDEAGDTRALIEHNYLLLGSSSFTGGDADPHQAAQQGKKLGAALVVLYGGLRETPDAAALAPLPFHPRRPGAGDAGASAEPAADTAGAAATIGSLPPRPAADHEATYWGRNQPPLLGIMSRPLDQEEKDRLLRSDGIVVELVTNDSPAAAAHIQQGDIILAIDGKAILDPRAVPAFLHSIAGRRVRIDLLRDSTPHTVEVQLNPAAP